MEKSVRSKRISLLKAQAKGFWNVYKQNKKGLFGIGLIIFFLLFAYFGPMLTDNDPVKDWDVGGRRVPPKWFRRIPGYGSDNENDCYTRKFANYYIISNIRNEIKSDYIS